MGELVWEEVAVTVKRQHNAGELQLSMTRERWGERGRDGERGERRGGAVSSSFGGVSVVLRCHGA